MAIFYSTMNYLPLLPQIGKPEVLEQIAVRIVVLIVVDVMVVVEVLKANRKRALPEGAENPG